MKRKIFTYTLLPTLFIVVVVFLIYDEPDTVVKNEVAAFKLSASELIRAFSDDELHAQSRYVGEVIQVKGPVIETIHNGTAIVLRMGDSDEMMAVSSSLRRDQASASMHLQKGEVVTVKGVCNGALMDIVLANAVLINNER